MSFFIPIAIIGGVIASILFFQNAQQTTQGINQDLKAVQAPLILAIGGAIIIIVLFWVFFRSGAA